MTTTAYSNYGSILTKNNVSVGACIVTDFPEILTGKVNITNHSSLGKAESIPNGLISLGDITLSVICGLDTLENILEDMEAKNVDTVAITDAVETMSFNGYYVSCKKEAADAQTPDVVKATVVIACTGDINIVSLVS